MIGGVPKFCHISDFMRDTLHWPPVRQRILYRLSSIVWRCVLGIAPTYLLELFILTSACSGRQSLHSASRGDFVVPHARSLAQPLNSIRPSRLWVPVLGTVSHLNSALFHGICPVCFTSSLKPLFSPGPGLGVPLSSYLEVVLYKFQR